MPRCFWDLWLNPDAAPFGALNLVLRTFNQLLSQLQPLEHPLEPAAPPAP